MYIQLAENLGGVKEMGILNDLLGVPGEQWDIEDKGYPIAVDEEQKREKTVNSCFRDNIGVEAIAKVNGVDVVAFKIAVHDRKKNLKKEVDSVDQHRQKKEPSFSRHCDELVAGDVDGGMDLMLTVGFRVGTVYGVM